MIPRQAEEGIWINIAGEVCDENPNKIVSQFGKNPFLKLSETLHPDWSAQTMKVAPKTWKKTLSQSLKIGTSRSSSYIPSKAEADTLKKEREMLFLQDFLNAILPPVRMPYESHSQSQTATTSTYHDKHSSSSKSGFGSQAKSFDTIIPSGTTAEQPSTETPKQTESEINSEQTRTTILETNVDSGNDFNIPKTPIVINVTTKKQQKDEQVEPLPTVEQISEKETIRKIDISEDKNMLHKTDELKRPKSRSLGRRLVTGETSRRPQTNAFYLPVSTKRVSRIELQEMSKQFDNLVDERKARKKGLDTIRSQLSFQLLDEVIRQVHFVSTKQRRNISCHANPFLHLSFSVGDF